MKRLITFSIILSLFISCNTAVHLAKNKTSTFKRMEWMLGRWEIRTSSYYYIENWEKVNDTAFAGKSIMLVSGDTVLYDLMKVGSNKQFITLSTKSKISKESTNALYKLSTIKKDRIIFENPSNVEDKKVSYILKNPTTLNILIEGKGTPVESYGLHKTK